MRKLIKLGLFGLFLILTFSFVFIGFHLLQAQAKGKPAPPPNPLVTLNPGYVVTSESNALSVWNCNILPYGSGNPVWSTSTPGYPSVAVGDADRDGKKEIVVSDSYVVTVGKGKTPLSYLKVFINIYKEGKDGIWKTTRDLDLGVNGGYVKEDPNKSYIHEVMIADVNNDSLNEVVLLTDHNLAVFRYDGDNFRIVALITTANLDPKQDRFTAVTVGNIDEDVYNEILVSAYVNVPLEDINVLKGSLFKIDVNENSADLVTSTDPSFSIEGSLRVADLDGDKIPEICSTVEHYCGNPTGTAVLWQACVFVWDSNDETSSWQLKSQVIPGWEEPVNMFPYLFLDVGEIDSSDNGEEIVVSANSGFSDYYLYCFKYDGSTLSGPETIEDGLFLPDAYYVSDIEIGNVLDTTYAGNEIVVVGKAKTGINFYLEVFNSSLSTIIWERIGQSPKGGSVLDAAIVK